MAIQYHDFDLLIEQTRDGYKARILGSPAGEASVHFNLPFQPADVEDFYSQIGLTRLIESTQMQKMRIFGQELFEAAISGNVRDKFRESLSEANRDQKGLRIRLRLADVPELANMPWEFMYDASQSRFLTLSIETPLVRYLDIPRDIQPLTISPPLQILVVISGPKDFPTLNVQHEWDNLQEALGRLETRGLVKLTQLKKPTLQALQHQLRKGEFHIFHFIGHGIFSEQKQDGQLLFENELRRGDPVSGRDLGILLHDHKHLRLAVLNSCEGARTSMEDQFSGTAQSLMLQGIPAVIAMQFRITDIAAITLAREFYAALADSYPVDAALTEARKALKTHDNELEWGTPVLYMRSPDGQVFDVEVLDTATPVMEADSFQNTVTETRLSSLYTEGLESFYLRKWADAVSKFNAILSIDSSYKDVSQKIDEAQRQLKLTSLDQQAQSAEASGEWQAAIEALDILVKESPGKSTFSSRLENARKQLRLDNLYIEARHLSKAGKWLAVVEVFREIHSLDTQYPDPEELLFSAEEGAAFEQLQSELDLLYKRALQEIDTNNWIAAQETLQDIQSKQADYRQSNQLLLRVKKEIALVEKKEKEQEKIASLYVQAENLAAGKQWERSLGKIEEILTIQPDFDDPKQISSLVRSEIEKGKRESEKQDQLARMYAEAVKMNKTGEYQQALEKWNEIRSLDAKYPDKQKVQNTARKNLAGGVATVASSYRFGRRKYLWVGIVMIFLVGIASIGMILSRNGVLNSLFGPKILFYDDFNEPVLNSVYEQLPNAAEEQSLDYSLETLDGYSVVRFKNWLSDSEVKSLQIAESFKVKSAPVRFEVRFNPLVQSRSTSIDGFLEFLFFSDDYSDMYRLDLFAGNFGTDIRFLGYPIMLEDNSWYRLVVAETDDQKYRASIYDDSLQNELVGVDLDLNRSFFQSGMKIRIVQSMGGAGGIFPVDVAIDWLKLSTD